MVSLFQHLFKMSIFDFFILFLERCNFKNSAEEAASRGKDAEGGKIWRETGGCDEQNGGKTAGLRV